MDNRINTLNQQVSALWYLYAIAMAEKDAFKVEQVEKRLIDAEKQLSEHREFLYASVS